MLCQLPNCVDFMVRKECWILLNSTRHFAWYQKMSLFTLPSELVVLIFDFVVGQSVSKLQVSQVCKLEAISRQCSTNQNIQEYFQSFWSKLLEITIGIDERLTSHQASLQKQGYKRVYSLLMAYLSVSRRTRMADQTLPQEIKMVLLGNGK